MNTFDSDKYKELPERHLVFSPDKYDGYLNVKRSEEIKIDQTTKVFIGIMPHQWNKITIKNNLNEQPVTSTLFCANEGKLCKYVTILDPGSYVIESKFSPPIIWLIFRYLYYIILLILALSYVRSVKRSKIKKV
jgi:hypothetical protein